jgi:hypothetical protein
VRIFKVYHQIVKNTSLKKALKKAKMHKESFKKSKNAQRKKR